MRIIAIGINTTQTITYLGMHLVNSRSHTH